MIQICWTRICSAAIRYGLWKRIRRGQVTYIPWLSLGGYATIRIMKADTLKAATGRSPLRLQSALFSTEEYPNPENGPSGQESSRQVKPSPSAFLILCEAAKEYSDFSYRSNVIDIEVDGLACDPKKLTRAAIDRKTMSDADGTPYDQIWCVFDRDDWPVTLFNQAFEDARNNGIEVAYSNEAFELWYLLHFNYYDTACSRTDYKRRLSTLLGKTYQKNDPGMYSVLGARQQTAIRNADRLLSQYNPPHPADDNPSTTVHRLVRELSDHARP